MRARAHPKSTGVTKLSFDGASVEVEATHGDVAVPQIVVALSLKGIGVKSVEVHRRTLNEVFIEHIGKPLSASEQDDNVDPNGYARFSGKRGTDSNI